ncbi:substance-K receptor-like [Oppia nitens]|uniref:substance-K receptor-like n=1 Tax=Oppia nitens TaxID=1686743 RepID=UPI0023DBD14C|nr:substance-K receptor-like [Oppia nitens]
MNIYNNNNNGSDPYCPRELTNESYYYLISHYNKNIGDDITDDDDDDYYFDPSMFDPSKCNFSDGGNPIWWIRPVWNVAAKSAAVLPVMVVGIFGNLAVICLILKLRPLRRSPVNLFILNMALADLLTTLFCPWIALVDNIYQIYVLGSFFCRLDGFIKILCLLTSVFSLMTISIDRYIAICLPNFRLCCCCGSSSGQQHQQQYRRLNKRHSYIIIAGIWLVAIILSAPLIVWRSYRQRQWLDFLEIWCPETNTNVSKYYWLFLMLPLVYIPLSVVIIIYAVIIVRMNRFARRLSAEEESHVKHRYRQTLVRMLFLYVLTTIICWFPLQLLVYYRRFHLQLELFASANSAINPIVTFRQSFSNLLPKLFEWRTNSKRKTIIGNNNNKPNRWLQSPGAGGGGGPAIIYPALVWADDCCWPSSSSVKPISSPPLHTLKSHHSNGVHTPTTGTTGTGITNNNNTTTQSYTKQILMQRAPELYYRNEA